jgi:hypothetical protein
MPRIRSFSTPSILTAAICWSLAAAPRVAGAQTSASETARATELFKNGKAAFSHGDMAEAERLFGQALALRKSSDIAANLGQSELEQQKFRQSAEHFSWALANLLPSATDAQRKAVETGLARARAEVAVLRLEIKPDGADVLVGDQALGKAPIANGVFVDPGEVIVSVKRDGFVAIDKRVMVAKGTEQAVEVELQPKESAPLALPAVATAPVDSGLEHREHASEPGADRGAAKSLVPAFVASGVALAGGVVGLVFTVSANSKSSAADDLRDQLEAMGGCSGGAVPVQCADLKDERSSVDSKRNLAVGSFVVGGVAAVVAGFLYWHALAHRSTAKAALLEQPALGLVPSLELGRARAGGQTASDSFKLSVSGTF